MSDEQTHEDGAISRDQLDTFISEIIRPSSLYTLEPLSLKLWDDTDTYYLHDYYPARMWKYIDDKQARLSKDIYESKDGLYDSFEFELLWAIMQMCRDIPEETIWLYSIPSSSDNYCRSGVNRVIDKIMEIFEYPGLGAECNPSPTHPALFIRGNKLYTLMYKLFCKDKYIEAHENLYRKIPIIPNHERARRKMRRATYDEQLLTMGLGHASKYAYDPLGTLNKTAEDTYCKDGNGQSIACLIIDDIITNGCTMDAAQTLVERYTAKHGYNASIYGLTLAKTVRLSSAEISRLKAEHEQAE